MEHVPHLIWFALFMYTSNLIHNQWHKRTSLLFVWFYFWNFLVSIFYFGQSNEKRCLGSQFVWSCNISQWVNMFTFCNQKTINMIDGIWRSDKAYSIFFIYIGKLMRYKLIHFKAANPFKCLKIDFQFIFIVHCSDTKERKYKNNIINNKTSKTSIATTVSPKFNWYQFKQMNWTTHFIIVIDMMALWNAMNGRHCFIFSLIILSKFNWLYSFVFIYKIY